MATRASSSNLAAHAALVLANASWGLISPVIKHLLLMGPISALALSGLRILGATALFWIVSFAVPSKWLPKEKIARRDWLPIFVSSLLIITLNQALYIIGLEYTSPIDSSVVSSTTPIFTMILAAIFISEPITRLKGFGVLLGMIGTLMLIFSEAHTDTHATNPMLGNSLCLVAQFCAAVYYVFYKGLASRYSAFTLMKWMFLFSAASYALPFCIGDLMEVSWAQMPLAGWADAAFIIVFPTFIAYTIIPFAQKRLKPTLISMYNYLQPVFSFIYSAIIGLAVFTFTKSVAIALIFVGVYMVTQSGKQRR